MRDLRTRLKRLITRYALLVHHELLHTQKRVLSLRDESLCKVGGIWVAFQAGADVAIYALEALVWECCRNYARLLLAFSLFASGISHAAEIHGKVVGVSDGDTITVLDAEKHQHKIRLAGIDAPEHAQAFGQASKKSLSDMVYGKQVDVNWDKRDRYGRIIGKVSIDQIDVCVEQVRRGMAWHYKQFQREQSEADQESYAAAENWARANRVGLWRDASPVPPWAFRRRR